MLPISLCEAVRSPRTWSRVERTGTRRVVVPRLDQGGEAKLHVGNPIVGPQLLFI